MCYSSSKDFGWGIKKEATREPEARQQTPADSAGPFGAHFHGSGLHLLGLPASPEDPRSRGTCC